MQRSLCAILIGFAVLAALLPAVSLAATQPAFETSGWLPYWRSSSSTKDVLAHMDKVTEVNPFVYTVKSDLTLKDNGTLNEEPWKSFIAEAKKNKIRVIPTIMWSDSNAMHDMLSDAKKRQAFEDHIAQVVKDNDLDGIDIDFEGKRAEDKDNFSMFLKGLYMRLGNKWLMCTVESRTPIASRYYGLEVHPDAEVYANDYKAFNKYCDRVRIMAYDQQGIDNELATKAASSSQLYAPVADPLWVEKTIRMAMQDIDKNKIMIGVPTYGYEYSVTAYANKEYVYDILWSFNQGYAWQIAQQYNITPLRAESGEMYFTYVPTGTSTTPVSASKYSALAAAGAADLFATQYNSHLAFRMLDWSDAQSIATKVALAKKLGVRGVSIFKMDGGEDQGMWDILPVVRGSAAVAAQTSSSASVSSITRGLAVGDTGADVKTLQVILNSDPDTAIAQSGIGSPGRETTTYGLGTQRAVQKFQVKYGIAKPGSAGYGYVGPATRAKLNTILSGL